MTILQRIEKIKDLAALSYNEDQDPWVLLDLIDTEVNYLLMEVEDEDL